MMVKSLFKFPIICLMIGLYLKELVNLVLLFLPGPIYLLFSGLGFILICYSFIKSTPNKLDADISIVFSIFKIWSILLVLWGILSDSPFVNSSSLVDTVIGTAKDFVGNSFGPFAYVLPFAAVMSFDLHSFSKLKNSV